MLLGRPHVSYVRVIASEFDDGKTMRAKANARRDVARCSIPVLIVMRSIAALTMRDIAALQQAPQAVRRMRWPRVFDQMRSQPDVLGTRIVIIDWAGHSPRVDKPAQ